MCYCVHHIEWIRFWRVWGQRLYPAWKEKNFQTESASVLRTCRWMTFQDMAAGIAKDNGVRNKILEIYQPWNIATEKLNVKIFYGNSEAVHCSCLVSIFFPTLNCRVVVFVLYYCNLQFLSIKASLDRTGFWNVGGCC